ncbi:MAG: T9SS type A sorting domain-containing protein [Crocinitomicaceae bacterium]|nr:T9SS type A sorting domain-containing protein [Crocinitomicaceae bacterium]
MSKILFFVSFFCCLISSAQVDAIDFIRKGTYQISNAPHIAFPSIIRLPNDSLLVVYRKGSGHVDLSGRIMKVKGSSDGKFWSIPQVLVNQPGIDERDPSVTLLADGRIMLNYYEYLPGNAAAYPPVPAIYSIHVAFSNDGGNTFSTPQSIDGNDAMSISAGSTFDGDHYKLPDASIFQVFACSAPAVEYGDRIILPAYGGNALIPDSAPGLFVSEPMSIYFFESTDGGVTWIRYGIGENYLPHVWKAEPALLKIDDGKVLMHYRCSDNPATPSSPGPMRQAFLDLETNDFVPDLDFGFTGQATDLLRLSCGVLVSGFRHVNSTPFSADVCMIYSLNNGISWSDTIRIFQGNSDCAYPSFAQISPNKLLVTYYTSGGWKINATIYDLKLFQRAEQSLDVSAFSSLNESEELTISMYPNPCKDFTNISLVSPTGNLINWRFIDMTGKVFKSASVEIIAGELIVPVSLEDVPAGNYMLELTTTRWRKTEKLVITG